MTWSPRFNFLSVAPFRNNLKAKIEGSFADALEWAAGQSGVSPTPPNFEGIHFGRAVRDSYPRLNLIVLGGDPEPTDGGDYDEDKKLLMEVEDLAGSEDELVSNLEIYVLALRSVATEMSEEEWTAGLDTDSRDSLLVTVGSERYGERAYDSENSYVQVGGVVVTIRYREVENGN